MRQTSPCGGRPSTAAAAREQPRSCRKRHIPPHLTRHLSAMHETGGGDFQGTRNYFGTPALVVAVAAAYLVCVYRRG